MSSTVLAWVFALVAVFVLNFIQVVILRPFIGDWTLAVSILIGALAGLNFAFFDNLAQKVLGK